MKKLVILAAIVSAACSFAFVGDAAANPYHYTSWRASGSGSTVAPLGFSLFCLNNPQQCRASGRTSVTPTSDVLALLRNVNAAVNHSIRPRLDQSNAWTVDPASGYGECDNYAMTKRSHLITSGMPASALRIAYVKTPGGEDHAVLVVRTGSQQLVLDNLTGAILPIEQTGLRLMSISGANPTQWGRT